MDINVEKQNQEKFEVKVTDNAEKVHRIGVEGIDIIYHNSEDYPDDPDERTPEQNERVAQARLYARYWTYCMLESTSLENNNNPVHIDAVRSNLNTHETSDLKENIEPLYKQLKYDRGESGGKKIIDVPEDENYIYNVDVKFVGQKLEQERVLKEMLEEHNLDISEEHTSRDLSPEEINEWAETPRKQEDIDSDLENGFQVETVSFSPVYASVYKNDRTMPLDESRTFNDRFATIEIAYLRSGDLDEFREQVQYNLRCQIRDMFVRMGVVPPTGYRVLGSGKYSAELAYENINFYQELHKMNRNTVRGEDGESSNGIFSRLKSVFQ
jgi:hypothetical protein